MFPQDAQESKIRDDVPVVVNNGEFYRQEVVPSSDFCHEDNDEDRRPFLDVRSVVASMAWYALGGLFLMFLVSLSDPRWLGARIIVAYIAGAIPINIAWWLWLFKRTRYNKTLDDTPVVGKNGEIYLPLYWPLYWQQQQRKLSPRDMQLKVLEDLVKRLNWEQDLFLKKLHIKNDDPEPPLLVVLFRMLCIGISRACLIWVSIRLLGAYNFSTPFISTFIFGMVYTDAGWIFGGAEAIWEHVSIDSSKEGLQLGESYWQQGEEDCDVSQEDTTEQNLG